MLYASSSIKPQILTHCFLPPIKKASNRNFHFRRRYARGTTSLVRFVCLDLSSLTQDYTFHPTYSDELFQVRIVQSFHRQTFTITASLLMLLDCFSPVQRFTVLIILFLKVVVNCFLNIFSYNLQNECNLLHFLSRNEKKKYL